MKIIAATDFSPAAANATRSAVRLARKLGDSILLVRVLEPPVDVYPEVRVPESTAFEAVIRRSNEALMEKEVAALAGEGVPIEGKILHGSPFEELVTLAVREGARLIVMGTRGHSALARLVLGSVVERTVRAASCPVLVVPPDVAPFERWSKERPLRILAGYDLDAAGDAMLSCLQRFAQADSCQVTLVHGYWPPVEYTRLGLYGRRDLFATDPEVVAVLEREIRARTPQLDGAEHTRLRIEAIWGPLGDTLAQDAEADSADLVVVGTRQLHGWQRMRRGTSVLGVLRRARRAVLCVPAPPPAPSAAAPIPALRSILVPTDFSDRANGAIPYAYSLLRGGGGTVELCHIHEREMPYPAYAYDSDEGKLSPERRRHLEDDLRGLIPADAERMGVTTHVTVIDGRSPAQAITQAARRLGVDAITIASHGRSGVARRLFGSVAEEVLRDSDKPVFVVRSQDSQAR
jgi:nucleotide-binding universal stress UspA family protein